MEDKSFSVSPVAYIYTDFSDKFGIPRQSGMARGLKGRVVLEPRYRKAEALRELEGFSHIWLIWLFSQTRADEEHLTVRPPRLGGNRRVGVFASRSPFRPNRLGLSCVELEKIDYAADDGPALLVSGVDIMSGTPILDIKPYVPVTDCRTGATEGYTEQTKGHRLRVECSEGLLLKVPPAKREAFMEVLGNDPRPGYADEPEREYGFRFAGFEIGFTVDGSVLTVSRIEKL